MSSVQQKELYMQTLNSKMRVAPTTRKTIPRLELLAALLLARLVVSITGPLQMEILLE